MIATIKGHNNVVKFLFESGADLNHVDRDDHSIFHLCAQYDRHEILRVSSQDENRIIMKLAFY